MALRRLPTSRRPVPSMPPRGTRAQPRSIVKNSTVQFRLRIMHGSEIAVGPGKIDLHEAIAATGSITAGAKRLGMSYRRAWLLVDTMNRCFKSSIVDAEAGGQRGGGATLTPLGVEI